MRLWLALIAAPLTAAPLYAQDTPAEPEPEAVEQMSDVPDQVMIRADDIEEATVYTLDATYDTDFWDSGEPFGPVAADWGEIGEVEDLIVGDKGDVLGVTIEVGGFLGIGEKTVLIPLDDLRLVRQPDAESFYIVTRLAREQLEEAEDIDDFAEADD